MAGLAVAAVMLVDWLGPMMAGIGVRLAGLGATLVMFEGRVTRWSGAWSSPIVVDRVAVGNVR